MATTDYPGIDYGLGKANIGEHGIRYGVVSANSLGNWIWDELEAIYWHGCPACGSEFDHDEWCETDNVCPQCGEEIADGDEWGDEPIGYRYDADGLLIEGHSDGDLFVIRSPVVANLQYCSPCAPGAGYMKNPCDEGPVCYVLPSDWWEEGECPYVPRQR